MNYKNFLKVNKSSNKINIFFIVKVAMKVIFIFIILHFKYNISFQYIYTNILICIFFLIYLPKLLI